MAYVTKSVSGPDIGRITSLYLDNAIIPNITANQIGMGNFFNSAPNTAYKSMTGINVNPNLADDWSEIDDNEWNNFGGNDWNQLL